MDRAINQKGLVYPMLREAILHIPMSPYAHGVDERHILFRLRAARGDLSSCTLYYGDRACRQNPVIFTAAPMAVTASDELYDYYEVIIDSPYKRVCYYFELSDGKTTLLFYADIFTNEHAEERSEYFQLPFNHRDDIADIPGWIKNAVVYNIFPDSFASGSESIAGKAKSAPFKALTTHSLLGGTLRGVTESLPYLEELGINCIYLNPIFAAEEYHKYDLLDYYHIDPCFGTNEDFKALVEACHARGMRVIIDGVFNHCGWRFFAFEDVVQNGENSRYRDWFYGLTFPVVRPDTGEEYPSYDCFAYERKMPKLNTANPEVVAYFCDVCRYWIREYDIDGWRLDVANEVNFGFWRAFRSAAKDVKPDCVLIGEVWESALPWLRGDVFDSTMNYDLRKFSRDFFALSKLDAYQFNARVTAMRMRYNRNMLYGQLNLLDSHDVLRFLSACKENEARFRAAAVFQMTFIGVPSIFYGDETGIVGIKESEYRRPMRWDNTRGPLFDFYQKLIALRRGSPALREGNFKTLYAQTGGGLYAYERTAAGNTVTVFLNASDVTETVPSRLLPQGKDPVIATGLSNGQLAPWGYAIYR